MPSFPLALTQRHIENHQLLLKAFDEKNLSYAKKAFHQDPLIEHIPKIILDQMFDEIANAIEPYLSYYKK